MAARRPACSYYASKLTAGPLLPLPRLLQLTLLCLATQSCLGDVAPLTALLQLEQLKLKDASAMPAQLLVLPAPAVHWPRLRAYHLARRDGYWEVRAGGSDSSAGVPALASSVCLPPDGNQPHLPTNAPRVRAFTLHPCPAASAPVQVEGTRVGRACYASSELPDGLSNPSYSWSGPASLNLNGVLGLTPVLLQALLPQGTQGLDGGESKPRGPPASDVSHALLTRRHPG